ncbi:hypothetical protein AAFF_G00250800 [Aldrovandia affinis]|uniref:Uncharacterized protein n=1 Tax=Aldrovandia affinis TaxID=143900 RepID=A0AAD7RCZ9_9TELE|nr:hypothetical protein AAFF_G00250800 [Aldrovandia affinis]
MVNHGQTVADRVRYGAWPQDIPARRPLTLLCPVRCLGEVEEAGTRGTAIQIRENNALLSRPVPSPPNRRGTLRHSEACCSPPSTERQAQHPLPAAHCTHPRNPAPAPVGLPRSSRRAPASPQPA